MTTDPIPADAPSASDLTPEQFSAHLRANHPESGTYGDHARFHAAFDGLLPHVHRGEVERQAWDFDGATRFRFPADPALDAADEVDRAYDAAEAQRP